jgi:uncharacterized protein (TIGR03086 family)
MTAMPDTTPDVITESLDLLRTAAAMISTGTQQVPTPCAEWNVTQVLQHAAGDQLAWAAALDQGVSDLLDPALATARTAWAKIGPDDAAVPTPLPQGELSAPVAAAACALDAAIHAWDIAAALGQPGYLPDDLATQLLPARAVIEPLRQFGAYAAALPPQPGDGPAAGLLRYLGRDPRWQPAS